jgi:hypothetical protein
MIQEEAKRIISMDEYSYWGDSIFFTDWEKRMVAGHMRFIPSVGDVLQCKMESGKIAQFRFDSVTKMTDPKDQFVAVVSDLEYAHNL